MRREIKESIARVLRAIADEVDGAPRGLAQGIAEAKTGRVVSLPTFAPFADDPATRPVVPQWLAYPNPYFGDLPPLGSASTSSRGGQ